MDIFITAVLKAENIIVMAFRCLMNKWMLTVNI